MTKRIGHLIRCVDCVIECLLSTEKQKVEQFDIKYVETNKPHDGND